MEYDIDFAQRLAEIALRETEDDPHRYASRRVVAYTARLSMEITLKALLEKAGIPLDAIRRFSHRLSDLLKAFGKCEVAINQGLGNAAWMPAVRVRATEFDFGGFKVPIGEIIDAENAGASRYPNEIRYGATVMDMHHALLARAAVCLNEWAKEHWEHVRMPVNL